MLYQCHKLFDKNLKKLVRDHQTIRGSSQALLNCFKLVFATIITTGQKRRMASEKYKKKQQQRTHQTNLSLSSALCKNVECVTKREQAQKHAHRLCNDNANNWKWWRKKKLFNPILRIFFSLFFFRFLCLGWWKKCNINALQPVIRKS